MRLKVIVCLCLITKLAIADDQLPVVFMEDFEGGAAAWQPTEATQWKISQDGANRVYHLLGKSNYQPPHRSPHSISLRKKVVVADFVLTAKVKTLQSSRAHRDMCLFFGYQDAAHFYYVHLGEKTDPHANQIFIVNDAPRVKISEKTNSGTPWRDNHWHHVKIVRQIKDGLIEIYFDDMKNPQMVAHDSNFTWGQVGIGSFDDLGQWDDIVLRGKLVERPAK